MLPQADEVYVLAQSVVRTDKERTLRRRKLKRCWQRLHKFPPQDLTRGELLEKLGAARNPPERGVAGLVKATVSRKANSPSPSIAPNCRPCAAAKAGIGCTPTCALTIPNWCGVAARRWCSWRKPSALPHPQTRSGVAPIYHHGPTGSKAPVRGLPGVLLEHHVASTPQGAGAGLMPRMVFRKLATLQFLDTRGPTTDGRELRLAQRPVPANQSPPIG